MHGDSFIENQKYPMKPSSTSSCKRSIGNMALTSLLISELSKSPCVTISISEGVGRCADYVLGDYSNVINTFIYAYKDDRLNRIMDIYKLTEKQAADKIKKTDRERKLYYEARTGREWGGIESNSMMFNTSLLGIDGAVDALEAIYRKWDAGRDVES